LYSPTRYGTLQFENKEMVAKGCRCIHREDRLLEAHRASFTNPW